MAANKRRNNSMLAGLENLMEKPVEIVNKPEVAQTLNLIREIENKPQKVVSDDSKKKFGRPRKFQEGEPVKTIGVKLRASEAKFLEEYGGKYGGKTGYVTYLIREEMNRLGKD